MNDAAPYAPPPTPDIAVDVYDVAPDDDPPVTTRHPAFRVVVVLAAVVAVLIATTVTVWAVDRPGALPEDVLPAAGAVTFVRLDYDPTVAQSWTAFRFNNAYQAAADQAPSRAALSTGPLGWLFGPMLAGTDLTVGQDVAGWAGDKAGLVLREDGSVLAAVELDGDESTVRLFLDEYAAQTGVRLGYSFSRGYLVISDSTVLTGQATAAADQGGALSDDTQFVADVARLDRSRLGVVWSKLELPPPAAATTFSAAVRAALDTEIAALAGPVRQSLTAGSLSYRVYDQTRSARIEGRLVLGMGLRTDGVSIDGYVSGLSIDGAPVGAVTDDLGVLPGDEISAASGPSGVFQLRALPADTVLAVGVKGLDQVLAALVPLTGDATDPEVIAPDAVDPVTTSAVDEAQPLVGTDTAVGILGGGGAIVRVAGTVPSAVAEAVVEATGTQPDEVLAEQSATGTTSVVLTGEVVDATPLDNIPTFVEAMPGLDAAVAGFYVNLDWATFTQDVDALGPFSAFGVAVTGLSGPGEFEVHGRMLIDQLYAPPTAPPSSPAGASAP